MNIKLRLKLFTILLCISNLFTLFLLGYGQSLPAQLLIYVPMILFTFFIIYFFYRCRNWARILVLIGAVFGLFSFVIVVVQDDIIKRIIYSLDGILAAFLLWFLNVKAVREYFKASKKGAVSKRRRIPVAVKIVVPVVLAVAIIATGFVFWVSRLVQRSDQTVIVVENINTGDARYIIEDGLSTTLPREVKKFVSPIQKNFSTHRRIRPGRPIHRK